MLEIEELTKVYRRGVRANDRISCSVAPGQVLGLLGHNGAGKTTLLNQVVGLIRPTAGRIRVAGVDPVVDPPQARQLCAVQPQAQAPLAGISPRQAIEIMARIRGMSKRRARERAAELLAALDIEAWAGVSGDRLSGGVRRLAAFAMAAAAPGRVVMFDEPTNDVDPVRRRLLWQQVRQLADDGCAVVLVTHNVVEAERAVDQLVVLDRGTVVAQGTPAELRGDHADRLRVEVTAADEPAARRLVGEFTDGLAAEEPVVTGRRLAALLPPGRAAAALDRLQHGRAAGELEEFSLSPVSLEDVYVRLVGGDPAGSKEEADAPVAA